MRLRFYSLMSFLLVSVSTSFSQVSITAKLDSTKVLVGQKVHLEINIAQLPTSTVFWPVLNDSLGPLELLETGVTDTQKTSTANSIFLSRQYSLMAFDSGALTIPALEFNVRTPGQPDKSYLTEPLTVQVFLVPVDTTKEIRDIAPIIEVPFNWKSVLLIIGVVLVLIALGIWIYRKYFRKEKVEAVITKTVIPPHVTALDEIEKLRSAKLWQQGKVKEYYTELTDILRRYITQRWNVNAMELTTDEVLSSGFIQLVQNADKERLALVLRTADLVKFAKSLPLPQDHELCILQSAEFVKSSSPMETASSKMEVES